MFSGEYSEIKFIGYIFANFLLFFPFPHFLSILSSFGGGTFIIWPTFLGRGVQRRHICIHTHKYLYFAVCAGLEGDEDLIAIVQLLDNL